MVDELLAADVIVAGVPMYNFSVPSQFKAYIDNVVRVGRTFGFDRSRPGEPYWPLLAGQGKRLVILSSRGDHGYGTGGRIESMNHVEPSVRTAFAYMGIVDVEGARHRPPRRPAVHRGNQMAESRRRLPPLNALRAFEAAARHLSFKNAAAELFVTPTAVSHQIRMLEAQVGVELFDRRGNAVALTRAGERFFPVLSEGFDRIAQSLADLQREENLLTVSVTPAFSSLVLVPRLALLRQAHADITLRVEATEKRADLRKAEVDVSVRYGPARAQPFTSELLFSDRYMPVASPAWVCGRALPLSGAELGAGSLLRHDWKNPGLQGPTWSNWMATAGVSSFDEGRCTAFSEEAHAVQAALEGAGVALASSVLVAAALREGRLVQVHPLHLPGFGYHAEFLPEHPRIDTVLRFVGWLKDQATA